MKVRTRIFLVFVLITGSALAFLARWTSEDLKSRYNESIEEPLVDTARILAETIGRWLASGELEPRSLREAFDRVYGRRFRARIFELDKTVVDLRVYVTDARGIVLFDSIGAAEGEDYSAWNDVARTLAGEYGARSTPDDPSARAAGVSVAYVAAPVYVDERIVGVVSVGKPKSNVRRFLAAARRDLAFAAIAVTALALLLGLALYRWVSQPLARLVTYAERVRSGERAVLEPGNDEIGDVGRAMEAMRSALEGKEYTERYVQTLTHELKSPLAAISGAAELLAEEPPAADHARFCANIRAEAARAQEIVDRLLQLASLEKRRSLEDVERIDVSALIRGVVEDFHASIEDRHLAVSTDVDQGLEIDGERFLLRQALANLLQNAIDFSAPGGAIEIGAVSSGSWLELTVDDEGPGVPEFARKRVFERFYSLPRPDGAGKSTGLGLNFVAEAAALHRGSIRLEREGERTRARLRLPS